MVHGFAKIHMLKAKLAWLQKHLQKLILFILVVFLFFADPDTVYYFVSYPMSCPFSLPTQDPSAYPQPTSQDLAGFWDLLQLNIEDVRVRFQDLQRLKDSNWRLPPEKKVRGLGVQTALVSLHHSPRAKMAVCRRVVPSKPLQAVNSKRN